MNVSAGIIGNAVPASNTVAELFNIPEKDILFTIIVNNPSSSDDEIKLKFDDCDWSVATLPAGATLSVDTTWPPLTGFYKNYNKCQILSKLGVSEFVATGIVSLGYI